MNTFNLGEFMVETMISNLKSGTITSMMAITYAGNYCTIGWITQERLGEVLVRITAIASGQPDPEEETAMDEIPVLTEEDFAESTTEDATENTETSGTDTNDDVAEETEIEPEEENNTEDAIEEDTTQNEDTTENDVAEETGTATEDGGEEVEGDTEE